MITHIEANKLREEESTIRDTIRFISGKRGKKAKEDMARLEARKEEIDKMLEDAPIMSLSPEKVWNTIERWASRLIKTAEKYNAHFLEKFTEGGPGYAFSGWGQDLVVATRLSQHAQKILEAGNSEPDLDLRAENILQGLDELAKHLQTSIVSETRSGFMRSTNSMGNLVTLWELEADGRLYDELLGRYSGLQIDDLAAMLQSWKELQKELAEK
jgi:hypothetical protein